MNNFSFQHVTVKNLTTGQMLNVGCIHDAAEMLSKGWPSRGNQKQHAVKQACVDYFNGKISAMEANIYVLEKTERAPWACHQQTAVNFRIVAPLVPPHLF